MQLQDVLQRECAPGQLARDALNQAPSGTPSSTSCTWSQVALLTANSKTPAIRKATPQHGSHDHTNQPRHFARYQSPPGGAGPASFQLPRLLASRLHQDAANPPRGDYRLRGSSYACVLSNSTKRRIIHPGDYRLRGGRSSGSSSSSPYSSSNSSPYSGGAASPVNHSTARGTRLSLKAVAIS